MKEHIEREDRDLLTQTRHAPLLFVLETSQEKWYYSERGHKNKLSFKGKEYILTRTFLQRFKGRE